MPGVVMPTFGIVRSAACRAARLGAALLLSACASGDGAVWKMLGEKPGQEIEVGSETYKVVEDGGTFYVAHVGFSAVTADVLRRDANVALTRVMGCGGVMAEVVTTDQGLYAKSADCPVQ